MRIAGRRAAAAWKVAQDLRRALVPAYDRLPEPADRPERRRLAQPEDLLRVLESERVADVLVEVEHVGAERERKKQDRGRPRQRTHAAPSRPQEHEQRRHEREPDQPRSDREPAEHACTNRLSPLRRQERPERQREEQRVRLRRGEDKRQREERD